MVMEEGDVHQVTWQHPKQWVCVIMRHCDKKVWLRCSCEVRYRV